MRLRWTGNTADHMATLGMILRTNGLPKLERIDLSSNGFGDAGMLALCEGLGRGAAPSLHGLGLCYIHFGPAGAEALAAALRRGVMPKLKVLGLGLNPIGNQGVAALAAPLRTMPALETLFLHRCEIGDEGVASLVANLGKDDFKKLERLYLEGNAITDVGMKRLAAVIEVGGLPTLKWKDHDLDGNPVTEVAIKAVQDALRKRLQ